MPPPSNRWSGSISRQCTGRGHSAKCPQASHLHQERSRPEREGGWFMFSISQKIYTKVEIILFEDNLKKCLGGGSTPFSVIRKLPRYQRFKIRKCTLHIIITSKANSLSQS